MKSFLVITMLALSTNAFSASSEDCLEAIKTMVGAEFDGNTYNTSKDGEDNCSFYVKISSDFQDFMSFVGTNVIGYSSEDNIRKHYNKSCTISDSKVTFSYSYKEVFEDRKNHHQSITLEKNASNKIKVTVSDKKGIFNGTLKNSCVFNIE